MCSVGLQSQIYPLWNQASVVFFIFREKQERGCQRVKNELPSILLWLLAWRKMKEKRKAVVSWSSACSSCGSEWLDDAVLYNYVCVFTQSHSHGIWGPVSPEDVGGISWIPYRLHDSLCVVLYFLETGHKTKFICVRQYPTPQHWFLSWFRGESIRM